MKIISQYTDAEAVEDGTIARLNNGDRISNMSGLFTRLEETGFLIETAIAMKHNRAEAFRVYKENIGGGIFKLDIGGEKGLWLMPNENGGLTLMRPEDY